MEATSPQEKLSPFFWQSASKKTKKTKNKQKKEHKQSYQDSHLAAFPKKFQTSFFMKFSTFHINICGYYFFFTEYKLATFL